MQQQFIFPVQLASIFAGGVPGVVLVDAHEPGQAFANQQPSCLVYPLPWQGCNQPDCTEHVQGWVSIMLEWLYLQETNNGLLQFMPMDIYLMGGNGVSADAACSVRFPQLGALVFANRFPDAFDLLTTIEANALLNGRDPFVRVDYPLLSAICLDDLQQVLVQENCHNTERIAVVQVDDGQHALAEMNSRLIEQVRLMQESLERNYLENQALRYEARKSAETMQRAYRLIMGKSAVTSQKEQ